MNIPARAEPIQPGPEKSRSFERALLRHQGLIYAPLLLTALGVFLAGVYADRLNEKHFAADQHLGVADEMARIRSRLEGHIYGNINLAKGLAAAISAEPNLSQEKFAAMARHLLAGGSQLRNIGAAPGLVIRYMYPLEGNEPAVGLDLGARPDQRESALRARDTGEMVLAGPIALVQGGEGFIGRIPVFAGSESGRETAFWGLISAVIDAASLYEAAGLLDARLPIEIAIWGKDSLGEEGALFYGRSEVLASNPVLATVALPNGSWHMAAMPKGGWPKRADNAWTLRLSFLLGGMLIVLPVGLATWLFRKRQESLAALRASEARFRDLAEMSSDWFWETGPDGRFTFFSEGFARSTSHAPNQLLGKTREAFVVRSPGDEEMWERHARTLADRLPFRDLRYRYRRADGAFGWLAATGKPVFAADGSFRGYRGAAQEISKPVAAEQALIEAREKATRADRAKTEFLSNMSHELRSPLNAIIGFSQAIESQYFGKIENPKYTEYAENVRKSGEHLLSLINDLLDMSHIAAGKTRLNLENLRVRDVWDFPVNNISILAGKKSITLKTVFPDAPAFVRADLRAANQCLTNLLSNAVKFTPVGGTVTCRSEVLDGQVRFIVEDTGAGIAAEDIHRLGNPFEQVGDSSIAETKGTGLGLAITKKLVGLMGGDLKIASELGAGTRVTISLPAPGP